VAERVQFLSSRRSEGEGGGSGSGSSDPGPGEPPEAPSTGADDIPF
jgi:single-stranded DNA-binding protein